MKLLDHACYDEMSTAAVTKVWQLLEKSKESIEKFTIALSGGNSPSGFYEKLALLDADWSRICFFLVDERKVRPENPESNFRMIREKLLSRIDIPERNVFPVNVSYRKVEDCALAYEEKIKAFFNGAQVVFDLVILGIGTDGHTASLFPGRAELDEKSRIVIPSLAPERFKTKERITLTFPVLNSARNRFFIVSGKTKASVVKGVLQRDPLYPASRIKEDSLVFTDFKIPIKNGN